MRQNSTVRLTRHFRIDTEPAYDLPEGSILYVENIPNSTGYHAVILGKVYIIPANGCEVLQPKKISLGVLVTLATGTVCAPFGDVHNAAAYLCDDRGFNHLDFVSHGNHIQKMVCETLGDLKKIRDNPLFTKQKEDLMRIFEPRMAMHLWLSALQYQIPSLTLEYYMYPFLTFIHA
jgi:hypothetical protein